MNEQTSEIWKPVYGHEGKYEVSSLGRVRSLTWGCFGNKRKTPYIKKVWMEPKGYLRAKIVNRKAHFVHRLVIEAFHGPSQKGMECAHLNGIRHDNRIENLKWVTPSENQMHRVLHGTSNRGERNGRWKGGISSTYKSRMKKEGRDESV